MDLLKTAETTAFNTDVIQIGGFLRCKAVGWEDYKNCLVTSIKPDVLIAMTLTPPHTVTYIKIPVADISVWDLYYSSDFEEIIHGNAD